MEQKDYLLREIEKIGMMLNYIREKFFHGKSKQSGDVSDQFIAMKEMVLTETGLDLDRFLALNMEDAIGYINSFKGYNTANIELLADNITQLCLAMDTPATKNHLLVALQLYELCNLKSRTYSAVREENIAIIKNTLNS